MEGWEKELVVDIMMMTHYSVKKSQIDHVMLAFVEHVGKTFTLDSKEEGNPRVCFAPNVCAMTARFKPYGRSFTNTVF